MSPWISGASFQDDFAGCRDLLHLSHTAEPFQRGNSLGTFNFGYDAENTALWMWKVARR